MHPELKETAGVKADMGNFFTVDELREILSDFSIIGIEEDEKSKHYCVLVKKA